MAIAFTIGAEELHKAAETGVARTREWLDATYRFKIDNSVYDVDRDGKPLTKVRVPQLAEGKFERFDLVGSMLGESGEAGRTIYVECKEYSSDGNQSQLYDEYLAVCYSAFVKLSSGIAAPPSIEFMWATTHPFAQRSFMGLTTAERIASGCSKFAERLGDHEFDESIAAQLADRLWLAIVNSRVEEMIMGLELRKAVLGRILELQAR